MLPPSLSSSSSFSFISFLQFALALPEQLLVHTLLSLFLSLFFSIFHSRVSYLLLLLPLCFSSSLTLTVLILSHRHFVSFTLSLMYVHTYGSFLFLSIAFFVIEFRRDSRAIGSRVENARASLSLPFSRHAIVPILRPARFRSFYRTVDFDGFIRTLYSLPLYSRDLKSLIISATRAERTSAPEERIMKRGTIRRAGKREDSD